MDSRRRAALIRPFGLLAAILMATVAGLAPSALATNAPGNNGTVKIHEGLTENDAGEVRNEPHACTFHLHFYFADPVQTGTWEIQEWPPTGDKGAVVKSGTYNTAGDGEDRQPAVGVIALADGHYRLFWAGDLDKHDKMKTFWVECTPASEAPSTQPSLGPSTQPSQGQSTQPSAVPSGQASAEASAETSSSALPTGEELPAEGSAPPSGEVLDIVGTPPPTDTGSVVPRTDDQGWRVILIAMSAIVATAALLVPMRVRPGRTTGRRHR